MVRLSFFAGCILLLLGSCSKEEGEGGTSVITGKVRVQLYADNNFQIYLGEYYAPEEDVYIIYGDDTIYSNRFRTNYDGSYRFEYLREGKYTLFCYSEVPQQTDLSGKIPVMKVVEITEKNQHVEVEDIVIRKKD